MSDENLKIYLTLLLKNYFSQVLILNKFGGKIRLLFLLADNQTLGITGFQKTDKIF